jgi:release factor glutamine methyltransferase
MADTIAVGRYQLAIAGQATVGPPTPYTMLLAESIPPMPGATVVDIGTGSGILAIVACLQGASRVYIVDINPVSIDAALHNGGLNDVADRLIHLPVGASMIPLPVGETVDVVISNPAQLPLPRSAEAFSPYYAGIDGRAMIDEVITAAPSKLAPGGRVLMVHNSVTDFPKTLSMMQAVGFAPQVIAERSIELRPLFDREWLDQLGGVERGLYSIRDGRAFETIYVVEARLI